MIFANDRIWMNLGITSPPRPLSSLPENEPAFDLRYTTRPGDSRCGDVIHENLLPGSAFHGKVVLSVRFYGRSQQEIRFGVNLQFSVFFAHMDHAH